MIYALDLRGKAHWLSRPEPIDATDIRNFLERLCATLKSELVLLFKGPGLEGYTEIQQWLQENRQRLTLVALPVAEGLKPRLPGQQTAGARTQTPEHKRSQMTSSKTGKAPLRDPMTLTHLQR